MLRVTSADYNFFKLVSYIQKPVLPAAELVQVVQAFRSRLSLKWYEQFADMDPEACLSSVWTVLFRIADHEDPSVRISVYSALGGLLFSLLPFVPTVLRKSFSIAVQTMKETGRASIAVVASFLYIGVTISPSDLEDFITNTPVLHHFGVDVGGFIKYIPKFVQLMAPLDLQFHQLFLRSLLSSFGRNPNHDFVKSVVLLVSLNPEPMTKSLMEFVLSNGLNQTVLALGSQLLESKEIFEVLTEEWLEIFSDAALNVIRKENAILSEFEQACGTLSMLVKNTSGDAKMKMIERINENKKSEYPKHFQRLVVLLPVPFDDLMIKEGDANTLKCAKLKAISQHIQETDDTSVKLEALKIFQQNANSHGDVFTALIEAISAAFGVLEGVDDNILVDTIKMILNAKNKSWIQDSEILKLMTTIGLDKGSKLIDDFEAIVLGLALEFALAPHDGLANEALNSIKSYANFANIEKIIEYLNIVDYFDPHCAVRFLKLLNTLADALDTEQLTRFCGIVSDLILLYDDDTEIAGQGFMFLSKCKYFNAPKIVVDYCTDWLVRMYKWVTHNDSSVLSPLKEEPLPSLISAVETDVVASNIVEAFSRAKPLLYCYTFYVNATGPCPESAAFTQELVKLFPYEIIPESRKYMEPSHPGYIEFCKTIATILKNESSEANASVCCDFLATAPSITRNLALETVKFLIQDKRIKSGETLFSLYNFLRETSKRDAEQYYPSIEERMDPFNLCVFKIKMDECSHDEFKSFLTTVPFTEWPLTCSKFVQFLEASKEVVTITEFDDLDDQHMKFFLEHRNSFNAPSFDEYQRTHEYRMSRYIYTESWGSPTFAPIEDASKATSALPAILKGSDDFPESLACSFLRFSDVKLNSEQLEMVMKNVTKKETALALVQYTTRMQIEISPEKLAAFFEFDDPELDCIVADVLKKNPCILEVPGRDNIVMRLKPKQFIGNLQSGFVPKAKNYQKLAKYLSQVPFDPEIICDFVSELTADMIDIESTKKLVSLLRVIHQVVATVAKKMPVNFVSDLNEKLFSLQSCEVASVHAELSLILARLFHCLKPQLMSICDSFDQKVPKHGVYLLAQSIAVAKYGITSARISRSGLIDIFNSEVPSRKLRVLKALDRILVSPAHFQTVVVLMGDLAKVFNSHSGSPLFAPVLSHLASGIVGSPKFTLVKPDFVKKILPILFHSPNSPQFGTFSTAISFVTHTVGPPIQGYSKFIDTIIDTKPQHPRSAYLYSDFVQWLLQNGADKARRADIILQEIQVMQMLFQNVPSVENAEKLAETLRQQCDGFDPSFILFGKIAMSPIPTLPLLVLIHKYIRKCNESDIAVCKGWLESVADAYQPKELADYIETIVDGNTTDLLLKFM